MAAPRVIFLDIDGGARRSPPCSHASRDGVLIWMRIGGQIINGRGRAGARAFLAHPNAHRRLPPVPSTVICCNMAGRLEESKLAVLAAVVRATDAKVVLSTDWRRQAQLKRQVIAALKRLDMEVIGATPMRPMFQPIRPQEITEWLHANRDKFGITQWVAIDDRDLLNEHGGTELQGHMVRTHPNTGLTKRLGDVAIEILGGQASLASPPPPTNADEGIKEAWG